MYKDLNVRLDTITFLEENMVDTVWHKLQHYFFGPISRVLGFPCSSVSKESACCAGDPGSIPGLGRSPREANGNPL